MNEQLLALEQRLDQILEHFARMRDENQELRTRAAGLESENRRLREKVTPLRSVSNPCSKDCPNHERAIRTRHHPART